jgi:outer membrane lipase/esterase
MRQCHRLAIVLSLTLAGVSAAYAQSFSNVVNFGDSLSDGGNYAGIVPGAQGGFTTNPDPVAIKLVAQRFGFTLTPSGFTNAGGWNFAWGGAPTGGPFLCVPTTLPCRNGSTQLANYFARSGGRADPNALYSIWLGANDVFNALAAPATAQAAVSLSVQQNLGLIASLQSAGARYIVTYNLPDIGRTPFGTSQGASGALSISQLIALYNAGFNSGLAQLGEGIIPINTFGLINEILADPAAFGFSNVTGTACGTLSGSLFCAAPGTAGAAFTYAAGSNTSFLFADGVHPTGGAHRLLANVVIATITAPGQVSTGGEVPLRVYEDHAAAINGQIVRGRSDGRELGMAGTFGGLQYGRQKYDATTNTGAHDNNLVTLSFGADYRYRENVNLGAALSYGDSNGDFAGGGGIDGKEVLLSGYGVWNVGGGYLDAIASIGTGTLDIRRAIQFGPNRRIDSGKTDARHLGFEAGGGYLFGGGGVQHGPFAGVTWQRVRVVGYREQTGTSTAMNFDGFERKSLIGRIGYQLNGAAGAGKRRLQPFARVAYAMENEDQATRVRAGSNSMEGHFSIDGYTPVKHWIEADLGLNAMLAGKTELAIAYSGHLNDDSQRRNALRFDLHRRF